MEKHLPVLLPEIINYLITDPSGIYVDGTFGRGGHSRAILEKLNEYGKLVVLDRDAQAIAHAKTFTDPRFSYFHTAFSDIDMVANQAAITGKINGILLDLGVSSPQLEDAERGFSFLRNGPLDMRMDQRHGKNIAQWLTTVNLPELTHIIATYGEERYAKRIAQAIINARTIQPISTTQQLAEIVKTAHPRWPKDKHPATQTFQALRIFINEELEQLKIVLSKCLALLKVGGRLAIISFHSLEDRIVKKFIQEETQSNITSPYFPLLSETRTPHLKKLGRIKPGREEITNNPRSRSATLRIVEKIA